MTPDVHYLAINGSERRDGNNAQALAWAQEYLEGIGAKLYVLCLADLQIDPCGACGDCNFRKKPCEQDDDAARAVRQMEASDGVIFAGPVHGYALAPRMAAFLERVGTGFLRHNRTLTNKVAGVMVTGRRMGHVAALNQMLQCALLNRMIVVGYGFPALLMGDSKGEVLSDSEGMEMLRRMLERMVAMSRLLKDYERITGMPILEVAEPGERHRATDTGFAVPEKAIDFEVK